jgi:hypothetical protein
MPQYTLTHYRPLDDRDHSRAAAERFMLLEAAADRQAATTVRHLRTARVSILHRLARRRPSTELSC